MEKRKYFEISPLLTDKYMLTMCHMYFKTQKHDQTAVFEFFFRKHPFKGNFTVWAGLGQVTEWIHNLQWKEEDINEIKKYLPENEGYTDWLRKVDFSRLKVTAVKEGTIVNPKTPVLVVEGPLGLVQLFETPVLCMLNYATLIATNAARFKILGKGRLIAEFGIRRAQGPNGALMGSVYAYIGGVDSTSNVLAGREFGVPVIGTMAHSYVTSFSSFDDLKNFETSLGDGDLAKTALQVRKELDFENTHDGELASFIAFAVEFPDNLVCLIDTWDTIESGFKNYLCVAIAMIRLGFQPKGLRLDSGDLAQLSIEIRDKLDQLEKEMGIPISKKTMIIASDGINEKKIREYPPNYKIDALAIGTNLITCQAQPALGMVCKLVELNGKPIIKLSSSKAKMTLPGKKRVYRVTKAEINGEPGHQFDILTTEEEAPIVSSESEVTLNLPSQDFKEVKVKIQEFRQICAIAYESKEIKSGFEFDVQSIRKWASSQRETFKKRLEDKETYNLYLSAKLTEKLNDLVAENSVNN